MNDSITLADSAPKKFHDLIDELNSLVPNIQQGESQFGILGLVTRLEGYLASRIGNKLGCIVKFTKEYESQSGGKYFDHILVSTKRPVLYISRKFITDLIKSAKQGDITPVVNSLKQEIMSHVKNVRQGSLKEGLNIDYILFEVEAPIGDSVGTLASFQGALPVDKLSLVDTDTERDYIAKEVKKDHFVLHPTKEHFIYKHEKDYIQRAVINALYNKGLSENLLRDYLHIARNGIYKIIKEHISESANYEYKRFGNRISLSTIKYNKEK